MDNQKYNVFINFLKERNVYEDFCKNLKNFGSGSVTSFFEYCGEAPIDEDIIAEAFDFNDTDEGEEFWDDISISWASWFEFRFSESEEDF